MKYEHLHKVRINHFNDEKEKGVFIDDFKLKGVTADVVMLDNRAEKAGLPPTVTITFIAQSVEIE